MTSSSPILERPRLAVFPKLYIRDLCKTGEVSMAQWVDEAVELDVEGLEWHAEFLEMEYETNWDAIRERVEDYDLRIPMLCCSPDFTHPDAEFRENQVARQKEWIRMISRLGGQYCRVLSGQRRPELSRQDGIDFTVECIEACLPYAMEHDVTLVMENHYRDDSREYPEFAQPMEIFWEIVDRIDHPHFGVNYDPSNAYLAGEDPLELLRRVSGRVVTMRASDRYLPDGTLEDLSREGYARRFRHGEIGKGLDDYDAIFSELKSAGFGMESSGRENWISVKGGDDGMDQLARSVDFLKTRIGAHWPREDC